MRLKVRLTVQREVQSGTILQQSFTVVFIVRNQQCIECQSVFRQGSWKSLVQVRQRVSHKRTFLYLEQLILKHGAHRGCLSIEVYKDGMDFYFPDKGKAARFISFLENVCPIKVKTSKKLISTDVKSNVSNFKYTNLVEICPLCKDDLLFLPSRMARSLGNISRLVFVKNISNVIHLIDPLTGQTASMSPEQFWREPLRPLITAARSRMTRYVVLAKEPVFLRPNASKRKTNRKQKSRLASVTLAKEDDLGVNDQQYEEQSHVGYLLKAGDMCVGYDLKDTQFVDDEAETLRSEGKLPDVVVVRKLYGAAAAAAAMDGTDDAATAAAAIAAKKRIWRLQRLDVDMTDAETGGKSKKGGRGATKNDVDMDEEDFMQEVEADRDMRMNMNLYKSEVALAKKKVQASAAADAGRDDDDDDDDDQKVKLDELLDGLALDDGPDQATADGAAETGSDGGVDGYGSMMMMLEGEKAKKDGITYVGREDARHVRGKDAAVPVISDNKNNNSSS